MSNEGFYRETAREILRNRYPKFSESVIDVLVGHALAKPLDGSLNQTRIKREIGKRITKLVNSQFPHHQPRRQGRGALVTIGDAPPRGRRRAVSDHSAEVDPESQKDLTDKILSEKALGSLDPTHSESVQREKEKNADMVNEALRQTSPTNSAVLEELLQVVGVEDSLGELGRQIGRTSVQVKRALDEARDVSEGKRPRRPNSNSSAMEGVEFNPPTVSAEARWRLHDGAITSDIGAGDRRTKPSNGRRPARPPEGISTVPRPRQPDYVEHLIFGRGAVLQVRGDENVLVEFDCPGNEGKRRRIMRRDSLRFLNGNAKP